MKNLLLLTAAAILATLHLYGQGTPYGIVFFGNGGSAEPNKIWVNDTDRVGDGFRAAGTAYKIALYFGPQGTPEAGLTQAGQPKEFLTGANSGIFTGGNRTLQPLPSYGAVATIQARAWCTIAGIPDTYEATLAAGLGGDPRAQVGVGPVFDIDTKDPNDVLETAPQVSLQPGWRGFSITPVPEPSVIGLGLLGAGALLMLRRRK